MDKEDEVALIKNVNSTYELVELFVNKWKGLELHLQEIVSKAEEDDKELKKELMELVNEQFMLKSVADEFMNLLIANEKEKAERMEVIKTSLTGILKVLTGIGALVGAWLHGKGLI
jgi:hypothetical protein